MKSRSPFRHPSPGGVPHTERIGTNEKCEPARDDSNTKYVVLTSVEFILMDLK